MLKAYEFRIYPTKEQEQFLIKTAGLTRLFWNMQLARKEEAYQSGKMCKLLTAKQLFTELKPEAVQWVSEVDSSPFAAKYMDITSAFNNFYNSCKGKRKIRVGKPRFESKKDNNISITWSSSQPPKILKNGYLFITRKLGPIKGAFHRWAEGEFRHATIKRTKTGKWFVKICVKKKDEKKNDNCKAIGIDWNCRDDAFLTLSDGTKVKCPRFLREKEKQLAHYQRLLSKKFVKRKQEQSQNYYKAKNKVAKLHEKVANQRKDWLHKLSYDLAQKYQYVIVEDINLKTMVKMNHGKVIGDQGFGMLRNMIAYKTTLVKVSAKDTSKTCHICGYVNPEVVLGVERWECPVCSSEHDRDINAALNILNKGVTSLGIVGRERAESTNACGALSSAVKHVVPNTSSRVFGS